MAGFRVAPFQVGVSGKMKAAKTWSLSRMLRPALGQLSTHPPQPLELPRIPLLHGNSAVSGTPRISVVVPSFNQGRFLGETLESLVTERYANLELIVVDGESSDNSVAVIKSFNSELAWWVSEKDAGQTAAINKGFSNSTGEIMAWLNSDDCIAPGTLHKVAEYFGSHPNTAVVYGHRILIDENRQEIGRWILPRHSDRVLKWVDFIPQETVYWRRSAWNAIGARLDETLQFAMDWDLLLRFSARRLLFKRLPHFLGLFRVHEAQKTHRDMILVGKREMQMLRQRELGFVPTRRRLMLHTATYLGIAKALELARALPGRRLFWA